VEVDRRVAGVVRRRRVVVLSLLSDAHVAMSVPSTVKCSLLISLLDHGAEALARDVMREQPLAVLRELQDVGSTMCMSRNHQNRRWYPSCSQHWRSLRTQESAIRSKAFRSRSGGIDGRPVRALVASKIGNIVTKQSS
jgi:hypothetical protein